MKKQAKVRKKKKAASGEHELPELVTVMSKLVERIEAVEKKTDLILSRISSQSSETGRASQNTHGSELGSSYTPSSQSTNQGQESQQNQPHGGGRMLYKAICADCENDCTVPFKPTGERPVYCKECFARRKRDRQRASQSVQAQATRSLAQGHQPTFHGKSSLATLPPPAVSRPDKKISAKKKKTDQKHRKR